MTLRKTIASTVLVLSGAALSAGAGAASIAFTNDSGTYSGGGVTANVTVTGGSLHYTNGNLGGSAPGIGVNAGFFNNNIINNDETMTVTFDQRVKLDAIDLTSWQDLFDNMTITSNEGYSMTFGNSDGFFSQIDTFAIGQNLTSFTLSANYGGAFLNAVQISQVPLPAAAWLFGSALLGLGAIKRRQRQA
jgi:hypothetical protein